MATSQAITSTRQPALAAGTLGLWGQLFQAVTHMAPAAGIVVSGRCVMLSPPISLPSAAILWRSPSVRYGEDFRHSA